MHKIYKGTDVDAPMTAKRVGRVDRMRSLIKAHEGQVDMMRTLIEDAAEEGYDDGVEPAIGVVRMISNQLPAWYNCSRYTLTQSEELTTEAGGVIELLFGDFFSSTATQVHYPGEFRWGEE